MSFHKRGKEIWYIPSLNRAKPCSLVLTHAGLSWFVLEDSTFIMNNGILLLFCVIQCGNFD